jgi:hypothetical protein
MADFFDRMASVRHLAGPRIVPRLPASYEPAEVAPEPISPMQAMAPSTETPTEGESRASQPGGLPHVNAPEPLRPPIGGPPLRTARPKGPLSLPAAAERGHADAVGPAAQMPASPPRPSAIDDVPFADVVSPLPRRAARAARTAAVVTGTDRNATDVQIHIGRIEIRAAAPTLTPSEPIAAMRAAVEQPARLSLADYLRGDDGRPR